MEVFRRFFLSYSSIWAEEIARYAFIYIAWIGASYAIRERAHIRIDVILPLLSNRWRTIVFIFGDIVTLILAVVSVYWSMEPVINSIHFGSVTHGLRISQAWFLAGQFSKAANFLIRSSDNVSTSYANNRIDPWLGFLYSPYRNDRIHYTGCSDMGRGRSWLPCHAFANRSAAAIASG
jgi:hypothetical protein